MQLYFGETALPERQKFDGKLNMEDITNADYRHAKIGSKELEIKHLGKYHDFYLKNDISLLAGVCENFRKFNT